MGFHVAVRAAMPLIGVWAGISFILPIEKEEI
jgi:hypothetical protein